MIGPGKRRFLTVVSLLMTSWLGWHSSSGAAEPPALNPFGAVRQGRDDAIPGYVELSNGKVFPGDVYMTRDKPVKIYDEKLKRQREIPLKAIKEIECTVLKEWIEKEWRFKELALDEKMYTGRSYPSREYAHTVTLRGRELEDGTREEDRKITGQLSEIIFVQPYIRSPDDPNAYRPEMGPEKFLLHKRDKGEPGTTLKQLTYVKRIRLGEDAYKEGKAKRARSLGPKATADEKPTEEPTEEKPAPKRSAKKRAAKTEEPEK